MIISSLPVCRVLGSFTVGCNTIRFRSSSVPIPGRAAWLVVDPGVYAVAVLVTGLEDDGWAVATIIGGAPGAERKNAKIFGGRSRKLDTGRVP